VGLAILYSLLAGPLTILKTTPEFYPQAHPGLPELTDTQVFAYLNGYFFWCALLVLPCFVLLRVVAARVYASGLVELVQAGRLAVSELAASEREALDRLGLLEARAARERHLFVRFLAWAGTRVGRILGGVALFFIWFSFVAQIYVAEFFQQHLGIGWLNQPLVQLPWFHYLPARLKNPWGEVFSGVLVWLLAVLASSILRGFRRPTAAAQSVRS
jgi:hypothetical protein